MLTQDILLPKELDYFTLNRKPYLFINQLLLCIISIKDDFWTYICKL